MLYCIAGLDADVFTSYSPLCEPVEFGDEKLEELFLHRYNRPGGTVSRLELTKIGTLRIKGDSIMIKGGKNEASAHNSRTIRADTHRLHLR